MTPSLRPAREVFHVFVIGDSISVHYGPYLERGLEKWCRYDRKGGAREALTNLDIPRGSNGGDSSMVLEYLTERLTEPAFRPDLMLVNAGLHDIKRTNPQTAPQIGLTAYAENLERIVDCLQARNIRLAWMRSTPCLDDIHNRRHQAGFCRFSQDLEDYNAAADAIMNERGIPSIDLHRFTMSLEEDSRDLFCDHVHFHPTVRARQGAFLAGWIAAYVAIARP